MTLPEQMLIDLKGKARGIWDFTNNVILENKSWDKPTLISTLDMAPYIERKNLPDIKKSVLAFLLTPLVNWRYSKFVYKYTEPMIEGLEDVDIDEIPVDVLTYLPAHCVYIDLSAKSVFAYDSFIEGFFAYHNNECLNIVIKYCDRPIPITIPLLLDNKATIKDCLFAGRLKDESTNNIKNHIDSIGDDFIPSRVAHIKKCLVYLVYICSELPDMDKQNNTSYKDYLAPKKTKKGVKIFAPDKVSLRRVGVKLEREIGEWHKSEQKAGRGHKRPHLRKAHKHGYWIGKRDSEERKYIIKWVPPVIVRADLVESD